MQSLPQPLIRLSSVFVCVLLGCASGGGGVPLYDAPDGATTAEDGAVNQFGVDGKAPSSMEGGVGAIKPVGAPDDASMPTPEGGNAADTSSGAADVATADAAISVGDGASMGDAVRDAPFDQGIADTSSDSVSLPSMDTGTTSPSTKLFVGYYQTWSDIWKANGADTVLAHMPAYANVVDLAFMQPNAAYTQGSLSLSGTGVSVPYDGPTLKAAIAALHTNNPSTRIMISVGGATYTAWSSFNAQAVAGFVTDFGLDGVDIDYEPSNPNCTNGSGSVVCPSSDAEYVSVVTAMRAAMPRPKWLSMAAWSVGAYGEGQWANAPPTGSAFLGIALAVFKDSRASAAIDLVNVMSYDAGPSYVPAQALQAYQHYFKGRIAMGVEVPPEAWGGHVETIAEIDALAGVVQSSGAAGMMMWSLQKPGPAQQFATEICSKLGLSNCSAPL